MQATNKEPLVEAGNQTWAASCANDYYIFLELPEEAGGTHRYEGLQEGIVLSDVLFSYPNTGKNSIDSVCLEIKEGEIIAILGENGSGKTTLSKLLLGLYEPKQGSGCYDGLELSGGQTQRMAIARGIFRSSELVILDEPTCARSFDRG